MSEITTRATISTRGDLLIKAKKKASENFQSLSSYITALINADLTKPKRKQS